MATLSSGMSSPPKPMLRRNGQRHEHQGGEGHRDREAAEDHAATCRRHRSAHRVVVVEAAGPLLAPPGDHQQGVVDGDTEADQGDEVLHHEHHVGEVGQPQQCEERAEDRDRGDHERDPGQERAEDEGQHDERADAAEQHLGEHGAVTLGPTLGQQREPGQLHVGAVGLGRLDDLLELRQRAGVRVGARGHRRVQDRDGHVVALGRENLGTGGVGRHHPGAGYCLLGLSRHVAHGRARVLALDDEQQWVVDASAPEALGDLHVGLVRRLARQCEVVAEPVDGPRSGHRARRGDEEPGQRDPAAVPEHPVGQCGHARGVLRVDRDAVGTAWHWPTASLPGRSRGGLGSRHARARRVPRCRARGVGRRAPRSPARGRVDPAGRRQGTQAQLLPRGRASASSATAVTSSTTSSSAARRASR